MAVQRWPAKLNMAAARSSAAASRSALASMMAALLPPSSAWTGIEAAARLGDDHPADGDRAGEGDEVGSAQHGLTGAPRRR